MKALDALRVPAFRRLAGAYTINELGNWIGDVALAILVFDRTGSPIATALLFLALRFAPALLAPLLTARAEVIALRQILPCLYFGEAAIFALIAAFAHTFVIPLVLVLAAADGVLAVVARALTKSANVNVLGSSDLLRAGNAVLNVGITVTGAIGPAVAGVLVATAGVGAALAADAVTFVLAGLVLAWTSGVRLATEEGTSALGRARAGLSEAWRRPDVRRLLIASSAALIFGAAVIPIEVVYAKRTLHAGDSGYGLLMTAWGVGMVLGSTAFASTLRMRLAVLISFGMVCIATGYAGLAATPTLASACVFSAVGGLGNGLWSFAVLTALQQSIPSSALTALMALVESINQVMPAIGFILGGAITAASSPRLAYAISASGVALVLVFQAVRPLPASPKAAATDGRLAESPSRQGVRR